MGGVGSTRWGAVQKKRTIEGARCVAARSVASHLGSVPSRVLAVHWPTGEQLLVFLALAARAATV